ncbi:DUF4249 domain-containing protein [Dyadobacter pollutisoli]|uniref:DUF4249 domain-containing protein n=1 Tax=Dyadobacter pollutisoli TaxID=2910158 RepID=A0A9E8N6J7_9BACT|nr:DUF4249 domain-containing protein [Dyadobacter pollutisoli]WAC10774.1 DUF4249 domain-containing protein [Dyadobacter pollutisoli]
MKNLINKKYIKFPALFALAALTLTSCEDVINLETANGTPQLVADGWLTNQAGQQSITLSWSGAYFDNSTPKPVTGAVVTVTDDKGKVYNFEDADGDGKYVWGKTNADTLGHVGRTYSLKVVNGTDTFTSTSELKRVPTVDSVVYRHEKWPFEPDKGPREGYVAQFYARDIEGVGDTYWIKPVIRGKAVVDKGENISIAYDAAFGAGAPSDGLIFILPLRESITTDSLYSAGAEVGVELHSITYEAFEFLKQVSEQAANGGLFATPIANVRSNVINADPNGPKALGFFSASAVSRKETVIDPEKARPDDN